jgi:arylsulfatase A-like enzyme
MPLRKIIEAIAKPVARPTEPASWMAVYILVCAFFVGMEWLFFVTKPSFLNVFPWLGRARVFGAALLPLSIAGSLTIAALALATRIPLWPIRWIARLAVQALPTLVLAASGLLLVDNFTATVFGWPIAGLGRARLAYAAAVLVGVGIAWRQVGGWARSLRRDSNTRRVAFATTAGVLTFGIVGFTGEQIAGLEALSTAARPARPPNVLLIGIDGVNAEHLSLYGYSRDTSPVLASLARDALVFTNAYSNAANTGGALTAILTGRLPTETRVIFAPDILSGDASVLHLPALLRAAGYRTSQFAVRHYAASIDYNMRGGFDVVNGENWRSGAWAFLAKLPIGPGTYFLRQIVDRVSTRIAHLAGRGDRPSFDQVTDSMAAAYMDKARVEQLGAFILGTRSPWFAHIHLLVTHGATFSVRTRRFSAGETQSQEWMTDFYDDAVLDADESIGQLVALLRKRGLFDRTLIVVYSDHSRGSRTEQPVPLVIRLPGGSRHGRITDTVQTIDIAPTILDALRLHLPEWMHGRSLLRRVPPCRPVFASIAAARTRFRRWDYTIPSPPYFSLGGISLVHGNQWFIMALQNPSPVLSTGMNRAGNGAAGPSCEPLQSRAAATAILDHLRAHGYQVPPSSGAITIRERSTVD